MSGSAPGQVKGALIKFESKIAPEHPLLHRLFCFFFHRHGTCLTRHSSCLLVLHTVSDKQSVEDQAWAVREQMGLPGRSQLSSFAHNTSGRSGMFWAIHSTAAVERLLLNETCF